jgi:hypothetical protein
MINVDDIIHISVAIVVVAFVLLILWKTIGET